MESDGWMQLEKGSCFEGQAVGHVESSTIREGNFFEEPVVGSKRPRRIGNRAAEQVSFQREEQGSGVGRVPRETWSRVAVPS